ncbi:MAG: hypothetical protein K5683_08185 [Prevotella sp.]|nr:hypothetical protein [Prevotella sp.]
MKTITTLRSRLLLLTLACCAAMTTIAQLRLDARHLLLDGSLTDAEAAASPFVFNTLQAAVAQLADTTTIYVKPWVYWVDNPDEPEVVAGKNGREPFGMVIATRKLQLTGLCDDARDVVFASMRGQTQGAVGNFTMFDFHVDELTVENMTLGNFCNVDLDYPLRPSLGRKRRSDAITQAHVGYVHGRSLVARNVRFISRLNLNPLTGAAESLYENCHFECTDDALNGGQAIYRHCDFDLYGQKPFWSTHGSGPLFDDCDFYVRSDNHEMVFCKQGGPLTVINSRYHAPEGCYVGWTSYPQPWLRCYQHNFTLNGQPYTIGNRQPQNTVVLSRPVTTIPSLSISQHTATLRSPAQLLLKTTEPVVWEVEDGYQQMARQSAKSDRLTHDALFTLNNTSNKTVGFCIAAHSRDGRQAACYVELSPSLLPPPAFVVEPSISIENGMAHLIYTLELGKGLHDQSQITWMRDSVVVSVSHLTPQRTYRLTEADCGHQLTAIIVPGHQRSEPATPTKATILIEQAPAINVLETDFHDFPTQWQPHIAEGCWTVDGYKPADTEAYNWSFRFDRPMWEYAKGFNGAVGYGLVQAQRGARLMYTPMENKKGTSYGNMTLTLQVDPTKTAGQGFGSATGQYMDVCLKFDTRTLTGYGLRIIRTVKHAKAVDFLLVEYRNGTVIPLSEPVTATCYRTGCTIDVACRNNELTAHVFTRTPQPSGTSLPHEVSLKATIADNPFGGIHIQHTGTCGESTTMLHRLIAKWE